ncbi:MAG: hypothetical protein Kow0069_21780 [Promethearchaeota archaeon]
MHVLNVKPFNFRAKLRVVEEFDVVVVGSGIAGAVAARFAAHAGFKTLLLEQKKLPRHKACSGIQFGYFEKLLGAKIPAEALCSNVLDHVSITTPSGRSLRVPFKMFNFWRKSFDYWLTTLAEDAGADVRDETRLLSLKRALETGGPVELVARDSRKHLVDVRANFLIAADGLHSRVRKLLRPADFDKTRATFALNRYFSEDDVPDVTLRDDTLYQVWNVDYSQLMFAWIYKKDDLWCIGVGARDDPRGHLDRFEKYVREKYGLSARAVKGEGFSQTMWGGPWLGAGNLLLVGDAAGLVDLYRGVCMDAAAYSARMAVKAVERSVESGGTAAPAYENLLRRLVERIQKNEKRELKHVGDNRALKRYLRRFFLRGGLGMLIANQINKLRSWEKLIFLPT